MLALLAGGVAGGFFVGANSRDDEVAGLTADKRSAEKEVANWEAREEQLKLREARAPVIPEGNFPKGYPKTVTKADVPEFLRGDLTTNRAVAIAPGVFADYPKGTDTADVARSGSLIGRCASTEAYERKYGGNHSATCY